MQASLTAEELISFEQEIAELFNTKQIRAPIHLDGGNEEQLIEIFKEHRPGDWVCGSWRMHYKCLLAGVPKETLRAAIIAGRSISLCFPEYRIVSSAIVGGILPIALGLAWSIKRNGGKERVWCFAGDMTAQTGMFAECSKYAGAFDLPIIFIVENNHVSVCTPTDEVWGDVKLPDIRVYHYESKYPHSGAGVRVNF